MHEEIRTVRAFAALLIAVGVFGTVAGAIAAHFVPIALGVIAASSGVVLIVFAFLSQRKSRA